MPIDIFPLYIVAELTIGVLRLREGREEEEEEEEEDAWDALFTGSTSTALCISSFLDSMFSFWDEEKRGIRVIFTHVAGDDRKK